MKSRYVIAGVVTIILVLVSMAPLQVVSADYHSNVTKTWVGGTGDWETAGNWSPAGVPGVGDDVIINAGSVTISSAQSIASLTFSGGELTGAGDLTIGGLFTWALGYGASAPMSGTGETTVNGGISISSGWYIHLYRTLNNAGTADFSGDYHFYIEAGGAFNNLASATFNYGTDAFIQGSGAFNNYGTFNRTTSTGTGLILCPFNNSGAVNVQSGTLCFRGTGTHTGALNVQSGATLDFHEGTTLLNAGSSVGGAGLVTFTGATVTVNGTYNPSGMTTISHGTVNFNSDVNPSALTLSGGELSGTGNVTIGGLFTWALGYGASAPMTGTGETTANGGVSISSGWYIHLYRTLNNAGTANFSGDYHFYIEAGGAFNNLDGATFNYGTDAFIQGDGVFNNHGTFNRTTSTGTGPIYCPFNNYGTVNVQSGTLRIEGAFTQTETDASIVLDGGSLSLANPLMIQGGSLKGSGTITGDVSIGSSGSVDIELGGTTPGTGASNYDQLNISGSATLAGILNVTLAGGFTPAIGDSFAIMTFASRSGTFGTTNLAAPGAGRVWDAVEYNPASVVLSVIAGTNHAPVAADDTYTTNEDTPLSQAAPGVLANDSDADSDPVTAVLVSNVSHGALVLNADGSFTYTPAANYSGWDTFTYKANDGAADSNVATVTITINAVNDAPAAPSGGASYSTTKNAVLNQAAPGVLASVTDLDSSSLTAVLVSNVSHGTLVLNADGSFTYTPATGFIGSDSFTCKANDGAADSSVFTVTIAVTQGDPPTITSLSKTRGRQGKTLTVVITGTNLAEATALDFGAGITVGTPTATSATEITVEITIDSDAALGARDVVVTTPEGTFTLEDGFTVEKAKSGGAPVWLWPVIVVAALAAGAGGFFLFFLLPRRKAKRT